MASTSSATNPTKKHQVFLSFRGTDTRDNFVAFLYEKLDRNGIETYIDNRLQGGEVIEPALLRKIEESLISIVILSKHYADSTFCLRELSKILDCKKEGQIVIPVFYKVDPDDVGNLSGIFGRVLSMHEKKYSPQELYKWRQALKEIAELKGWDSNVTRPDPKLIQKIVDDIQKKLEQMPSSVSPSSNTESFVGITSRVKYIESLLSFESPGVLIVGIWGMGGIGKSTTAKAVYDGNLRRFDGSCFFTNPRKETQKHELQEIFREALKEDLNIKKRTRKLMLQSRKVLIVLDDVNSPQVLTDLVREAGLLGEGSRIIVTSRDRQVLINECEEDKIYEVKNLDEDDALELFSLRAFRQKNPVEGYMDLSKRVLSYVNGIPLVLEVLGCNLYKRSKEYWESKEEEQRKNRGENIKKSLEMCYDELRGTDQKVFLDIACFFGRYNRNLVQQTLDLEERNGIDRLIDMCLIKIVDNNEIWMHDVVRQLGREIVLKEHNDPRKRSRLWEAEDVCRILQYRKGTAKVEAILFYDFSAKRRNLSPKTFEGMDNLRLLKWNVSSINFPDGLEVLPNKLRSLCWRSYPLQSLPSNFSGVELVELDMPYSRLERLWNDNRPLTNLKLMNLRDSHNLWSINLSKFPNLEVLYLEACSNLVELPNSIKHCTKLTKLYLSRNPSFYTLSSSIGKLSQLVQLDLSHNQNLWSLPDSIGGLKCLANLDLYNCSELASLPDSIGGLEYLEKLDLYFCLKLASLPNSIGQLKRLAELNLSNCSELASLPDSIGGLECLEKLDLYYCLKLASLPNSVGQLKHLAELSLSNCSELASLPDSIGGLECLEKLNLYYCLKLASLPNSIGQLKRLVDLSLSNCSELASLPDSIGGLECLEKLNLYYCLKLASLPNSIGQLKRLVDLSLSNCSELASLPDSIGGLECLMKLNLYYCLKLARLPNSIGQLKRLAELNLPNCSELASLPDNIGGLECLEKLNLYYCLKLASLPNSIGQLKDLVELSLPNCSELASLPDCIGGLECLEKFNLYYCLKLASLPNSIGQLKRLVELSLPNCSELASLPDSIGELECLEKFDLYYCLKLASLPNSIGQLKRLTELNLANCSELASLPNSIGGLECLEKLNLYYCLKLAGLPNSIGQLKRLAELNLSNCSELASLPDSIGGLECLEKLNLYYCLKLASLPNSIGQLKRLAELSLPNCSELASFSYSIGELECLTKLNLYYCSKLASLPDSIGGLECLEKLNLYCCSKLASLPNSIGQLKYLVKLNLSSCSELASLPDTIGQLKCLTELHLFGCHKLASLPNNMKFLECLHIQGCPVLNWSSFMSLRELVLFGDDLKTLPENIKQLPKLIKLVLDCCQSLRHLPELPSSLQVLDASICCSLESVASLFQQGEKKYEAGYYEDFNFAHCNKLGENERLKIMNDAKYRIQRLATSLFNQGWSEQSTFKLCIPGLEVPKWFSHINAEGFSLENIEQLPAHLHQSSSTSTDQFLGFAFCAVVACLGFDITCQCDLITAGGHRSRLFFRYEKPRAYFESEHVFIWSIKSNCHFKKASFHFYVGEGNYGVVKCGVHLLFTQDDIDVQPHPKKLKKNV